MARVTVKLFATVREVAGTSEARVDAVDLDSLFSALRVRFGPDLSRLLDRVRTDPDQLVIMVNGRNVGRLGGDEVKLSDGDEIAIFPPVSGG